MLWRYSKSEVTIIQAPIKDMPQMYQKTWEKYRGYYSHIKDVARITMEFTTVAAFLEAISAMFNDVGVDVLDLKNRLDSTKWNPEDSGGYLDVMVNGRFKGSRYILEVQFTVKALLAMNCSFNGAVVTRKSGLRSTKAILIFRDMAKRSLTVN